MMRREVNFLHEVSRDAIDFVEAGGDIRAYPLLRPYYTALVFGIGHPVLKRREVRVAINEALDRNELVRNGMRGHGRIAEGPFWPITGPIHRAVFRSRSTPRPRSCGSTRRA